MIRLIRWCRVLGAVVILLGCTACSTTAKHTWTSESFPGIASLRSEQAKHVSLVFVHGMGGYSRPGGGAPDPQPAIDFVTAELGLMQGPCERIPLPGSWRGWLDHWSLTDRDGNVAIHAYALRWKPTTQHILDDLKKADNVPPLEGMRPAGTRKLKDSMTDRLGDVALYAGRYRETIQDTVIAGLMTVAARETHADPDSHAIVPVTWSLGSRILHDSLQRMTGAQDPAQRTVAERIPLVFMLANQIQFLALADQPPRDDEAAEGTRPEERMFAGLAEARGGARTTHVVGITDPSDLLSWPLPPSPVGAPLRLVNAYHSTATTALLVPGFGKVGNPLAAHTDYGANAQVLRWLVYGSEGSFYCCRRPPPRY